MLHEFDEIFVRYEELPDYDHAENHLHGVINAVYKTGNVEDLLWHLEEVLHVFNMNLPTRETKLQKKDALFLQLADYTTKYAKGV